MSLSPTVKKKVRASIVGYCAAAVRNEPKINYSQMRPFSLVDQIGTGWHVLDCSGFVINNYWNAQHDVAVYITDPSGEMYSGWGNTWTMLSWLKVYGKKLTTQGLLVGDIAMYDGHTTICSKAGSARSADFTSHGSESGPDVVKVNYRGDLVGVWRHPALL